MLAALRSFDLLEPVGHTYPIRLVWELTVPSYLEFNTSGGKTMLLPSFVAAEKITVDHYSTSELRDEAAGYYQKLRDGLVLETNKMLPRPVPA